jgi:serine/threonine-protein kinase
LQVSDAIAIARQIADALEAAHDLGIVHRDLKPANVKVKDDGTVKVLDFGLAKVMTPESGPGTPDSQNSPTLTARATQLGVVLGTAAYMSPEHAKGRAVDKRADIWAFGCVLFEMLSGQRAFTGDDVSETLASVLRQDVEWARLPPSTPAAVRRLLGRCLERDVKMRLRDIGEARVALSSPSESLDVAAVPRSVRPRPAWIMAIGGAAIVAAVVLGWRAANWSRPASPEPDPVYAQLAITQPDADSLRRLTFKSMAFTPDGRTVIFSARDGDHFRLYRRQLGKEDAMPITQGEEGAAAPFVSPDGRWVGFMGHGALRKVPIGGGSVEIIYDLTKTTSADAVALSWGNEVGGVGAQAFGAAWLPDQSIVYGRFAGGLWRTSSAGGAPAPVTSIDAAAGEFAHRLPHALPGGRAVLFTVQRDVFGGGSIDAVDLLSQKRTRVIDDGSDARFVAPGHLLFAREGALFTIRFDASALRTEGEAIRVLPDVMHAVGGSSPGAASGAAQFDMSVDGTLAFLPGGVLTRRPSRIAWVSRGGRTEPLDLEPMSYFPPTISRDGRQLAAYASLAGGGTVYRVDLARMIMTPVVKRAAWPLWLPDGTGLIVEMKGPTGVQAIFSVALSGTTPPALVVESPNQLWPSSISADGKWLAYVETHPTTGNDIWVAGLNPKVAPSPVLTTPANESFPAFSPDGRWLAYASREGERDILYVRPFPGPGAPERVSKAGGSTPVWAPDGKSLFYRTRNPPRQILVAQIDTTGPAIRIGKTDVFAEDGFGSTTPVGGFSVSPDGLRLLVTIPRPRPIAPADGSVAPLAPTAPGFAPIHLILNARSLLLRGGG